MQIGQITSNNITNEEITIKDFEIIPVDYRYFENIEPTTETAIVYPFEKNKTYYLRIYISFAQKGKIRVSLCNLESMKMAKEMPIRIIPYSIAGYYDFIFTPDRNYNYLIFVSEEAIQCNARLENVFFEKIVNVLENKEYALLKDIGIQGEPGLRFSINGESFTLGKSGSFYLSDLEIRQLGFHIRENYSNDLSNLTSFPFGNNGKEFFIVNFQYKKEGD